MTVCVCASYDIGEIYKTNKYFTVLVIEFDISTFSKTVYSFKKIIKYEKLLFNNNFPKTLKAYS